MYKIPANTLFVGQKLVYVPQCHSTNTVAAELSQHGDVMEGTVVITDDQFAGRGQRGNTWEAAPGKNLTFSVVLRPVFLSARDQFSINQVVSLALADYLTSRTKAPVRIKWPNDIMVDGRKVCGILIENHVSGEHISSTVLGIGLNINQKFFSYPQAVSLHGVTGKIYSLEDELALLLGFLEVRYLQLKAGNVQQLQDDYLKRLYRRDEFHRYVSEGKERMGMITGVDQAGRLKIRFGYEEKVFGIKEVIFV